MQTEFTVPLFRLIFAVSEATDLINRDLFNHHERVAYFSYKIGEVMGLSKKQLVNLSMAGALHDIGAISIQDRMELLSFEASSGDSHQEIGAELLKDIPYFNDLSKYVLHHHLFWNDLSTAEQLDKETRRIANILHLADRAAVAIDNSRGILGQVPDIIKKIDNQSGTMFDPAIVDAFSVLSSNEYFWLDSVSPNLQLILEDMIGLQNKVIPLQGLLELATVFSRIIDFRSAFTATHSSGVAAGAQEIAQKVGFSDGECILMNIAGLVHDLGKLAVPNTILEKPDKLSKSEFDVIRGHTYYTYRILDRIPALNTVKHWAAFHHERMDGKGYPFHRNSFDLSLGSRILGVADVFTAITEDRPYRNGMTSKAALDILFSMANQSAIDKDIVAIVERNFETINEARIAAQQESRIEYTQATGRHTKKTPAPIYS